MTIFAPSGPLQLEVRALQFGILSPEEIKAMSVTSDGGIKYAETMEGGEPKLGGLMDPRQGCVDRSSICQTCSGNVSSCPRHFGHIELAKPVFHIGFIKKTQKLLGCVCFHCSKILVDVHSSNIQEILRKTKGDNRRRILFMYEECKNRSECLSVDDENECEPDPLEPSTKRIGCGRYQPRFRRNGLEMTAEWKKINEESQERKISLTAERVLEVFRRISDDDCIALGFDPRYARPD
ncbi:unnamed protein product [Dicrocoelium dendriticum]|nr:unnamed protein product [Dicrocoelium dendriticum]